MRILQNTLYVTSPDAYLALEGENIVVSKGKTQVGRVPLHNLEGVVAFGYTGASPALMGACAQRGIALTFLTAHGRFLARVEGAERGNVVLRKTQYRASDSEVASADIARAILTGKLYNSRWVLERALRDHNLRLDAEEIRAASQEIAERLKQLQTAGDLDALRGIEGEAARRYFSALDQLILQQKETFFFRERSRRPPTDPFNALLSFVYTLLSHDVAAALQMAGLDPYVGFLHRDRPGRLSLALDLMEELRPILADRFVLTLVNNRQVGEKGFARKENGAVLMDDDTRKTVLAAWQKKKQEMITHPFLGEKLEWGLVPYVQSLLLARFLRGDLDGYPPFLWK
ncbi:type I-C CRISPR-associated endonuclease Cas1c [Bittarella sp. HCP28S3_D9]|uniref:type I-C CRISPR-associated endonuclease Cas1c n=1 Tax=Bittarella sp. HCP28S3_D9 TaxID=3440253 RepID=UPI003F8BD2A7